MSELRVANKLSKCFRCGQPCNPVLYVRSKRGKDLPLCQKCKTKWLEKGRMPK